MAHRGGGGGGLTFVDLFCGAGGMTEGLKQAGLTHAVGVEWDPVAAATYAANHGDVIVGDIAGVDGARIRPYLHGAPLSVLTASPPCQSFSSAGTHTVQDARDGMFGHVLRLARELRPRFLVIENVPGLMTKRGRDGALVVAGLVRGAAALGYRVAFYHVCTEDYGVPQLRRRVLMLGALHAPAPALLRPPAPRPADVAVRRVLEPDDRVREYVLTDAQAAHARRRMPAWVHLLDRGQPARTVLASDSGRELVLDVGGGRLRHLSPREMARVQTFPDSYTWVGTDNQRYKQVGNAVPVRLGYHVGKSLLAAAGAPGGGVRGATPAPALPVPVRGRGATRRRRGAVAAPR
jgi:DNA (cytosine-5)-methyltransferase 1